MSETKGDLAAKVMAEPSLPERLRLLNRGQGWMVAPGRPEKEVDEESRATVRAMRAVHARNIARCDGLIAELASGAGVSREARRGAEEGR